MSAENDFYVGYRARAPAKLAGFLRGVVAGLLALAVALAIVLTTRQAPFDPGVFEYGEPRPIQGTLYETPYPVLLVEDPPAPAESRTLYLAVFGKVGADSAVTGLHGSRVALEGSLIYRGRQAMIEVVPGSVEVIGGEGDEAAELPVDSLGRMTMRGEILDSKCYLGVMKPGHGKTHRACAARCISGGIPPILRTRTEDGGAQYLVLVDHDGRAVGHEILDMVAEKVEITGTVRRQGDLVYLAADPESYVRLR